MQPSDVTRFWFDQLSDDDRWTLGERLDETIADRFGGTHRAASAGELWEWRDSTVGRLAEIIVLDQFSRHIFRNKPGAFANDAAALVLAQEAVRVGADRAVNESMRLFFYMPFMHSESLIVHAWATDFFLAWMAPSNTNEVTGESSSVLADIRIGTISWVEKALRKNCDFSRQTSDLADKV
jgi:uncharacterized protein (DUF924 family)